MNFGDVYVDFQGTRFVVVLSNCVATALKSEKDRDAYVSGLKETGWVQADDGKFYTDVGPSFIVFEVAQPQTERFLAVTADEDGFTQSKVFDSCKDAYEWAQKGHFIEFRQITSFTGELVSMEDTNSGVVVNNGTNTKVLYQFMDGIVTVDELNYVGCHD